MRTLRAEYLTVLAKIDCREVIGEFGWYHDPFRPNAIFAKGSKGFFVLHNQSGRLKRYERVNNEFLV